ncbi:hypothetical protein FNV43_RR01188 [Rhamnella rubrinervis]|uniref:Electron transfer flavoprotein-ubiquinone oxidoreductase n=1 Tax=Rhamnella rubrinervis TaxID=2594499 RepID=A0A8K0HQ14_9ROSA|nr:hypothetical protein FNV43_RR01188 [Rhamnella rubrinervis]
METYWDNVKDSWIWEELYRARNYRPAFEYGLIPGLAISALEQESPITLKHGKPDHEATDVAPKHHPIQYPKPDGVFSFDVPTSLHSYLHYWARVHTTTLSVICPFYPVQNEFVIGLGGLMVWNKSNTNHEHDQPAHLRLRDPEIPKLVNLPEYAGPESRYCPARVYE